MSEEKLKQLEDSGYTEVKDGDILTPVSGDKFYLLSGSVTINGIKGGDVSLFNESKALNSNQQRGTLHAYDNSSVENVNQEGGVIWGYNNSAIVNKRCKSGLVYGNDDTTITNIGDNDNYCYMVDRTQITSNTTTVLTE